jgi:hypothetical protein
MNSKQLMYIVINIIPFPVATQSKAYLCGRLVFVVASSNPAEGMDVFLLCLYVMMSCVGRGIYYWQFTCPEESYRPSSCVW